MATERMPSGIELLVEDTHFTIGTLAAEVTPSIGCSV